MTKDNSLTFAGGMRVLKGALALGLLADALLRGAAWGINIALWVLALAVTIALLARQCPSAWSGETRWLTGAALGFAAAFAWRDSSTLHLLDTLALVICLGLMPGNLRRERRLECADLTDCARGLLRTGGQAAFGGFGLVFRDIPWRDMPQGSVAVRRTIAVGGGLALAIPPLLLFGSLLAAADPIFARLMRQGLDWNISGLSSSLSFIGIAALLAGGFLRALCRTMPLPPVKPRSAFLTLGTIEVCVALGLLDLLFLLFVLVQIQFFFGGSHAVQVTPGLTYAEYARGGFFELVTVAALVLPLLLLVDWLHQGNSLRGQRAFQWLAALQICLLFLIMASAWQRMQLYQAVYGLTELRLYTSAFMAWLSGVFIWFLMTVLRGRRERFALGALLTAFAIIAVLHLINPDGQIVRVNARLARTGHAFDVGYALSLSADAVPALLAARSALLPAQSRSVTVRLASEWQRPPHSDWRSWNWSRVTAQHLISWHVAPQRHSP